MYKTACKCSSLHVYVKTNPYIQSHSRIRNMYERLLDHECNPKDSRRRGRKRWKKKCRIQDIRERKSNSSKNDSILGLKTLFYERPKPWNTRFFRILTSFLQKQSGAIFFSLESNSAEATQTFYIFSFLSDILAILKRAKRGLHT